MKPVLSKQAESDVGSIPTASTDRRLYENFRYLNEEAFRPRKMGRGKPISYRSDFKSPYLYGDSYHQEVIQPEWDVFM